MDIFAVTSAYLKRPLRSEAEARAMTEKSAKPTPDEWFVRDCPQVYGDIEVVLGDDFKIYIPLMATDWNDAKRSRMRNHAELIAAAPETAAERDRLVEALLQAEAGAAVIVAQISAPQEGLSPATTAWVVKQAMAVSNRARAVLAETRKP